MTSVSSDEYASLSYPLKKHSDVLRLYRSIDEQSTICRKTKKQTKFGGDFDERRACLIQKWMEDDGDDKVCEKPVIGRKSAAADLDRGSIRSLYFNSSSRSSESSSGGGLSSSEGDLMYGVLFKPKPIRTKINENGGFVKREKQKSKFVKTKSKAMKIYNNLKKKIKQPISPGGRLSSILNSLLTTGNNKKSKTSSSSAATPAMSSGNLRRPELSLPLSQIYSPEKRTRRKILDLSLSL